MQVFVSQFTAHSLEDTARFAASLAEFLVDVLRERELKERGGVVVSLIGTLGAGKTRLVQELAVSLGVERSEVVSPTFVLLREYSADACQLYHFDVYRLDTAADFARLAPDEYFSQRAITLVEWGDKFPHLFPEDHFRLTIDILDADSRRFTLTPNREYGEKVCRK